MVVLLPLITMTGIVLRKKRNEEAILTNSVMQSIEISNETYNGAKKNRPLS